jgi:PhoH-like ATPase
VDVALPEHLPEDKMDNRILKVCLATAGERSEAVTLVTKDILLRVKAQMIGVAAEDFMTEQVGFEESQYTGRIECYVDEEKFKDFKKKGVSCDALYQVDDEGETTGAPSGRKSVCYIKGRSVPEENTAGKSGGQKVVPLEYKKEQTLRGNAEKCRDSISCRKR